MRTLSPLALGTLLACQPDQDFNFPESSSGTEWTDTASNDTSEEVDECATLGTSVIDDTDPTCELVATNTTECLETAHRCSDLSAAIEEYWSQLTFLGESDLDPANDFLHCMNAETDRLAREAGVVLAGTDAECNSPCNETVFMETTGDVAEQIMVAAGIEADIGSEEMDLTLTSGINTIWARTLGVTYTAHQLEYVPEADRPTAEISSFTHLPDGVDTAAGLRVFVKVDLFASSQAGHPQMLTGEAYAEQVYDVEPDFMEESSHLWDDALPACEALLAQ